MQRVSTMHRILHFFAIRQPPVPFAEKWLAGGLASLAFVILGFYYGVNLTGGSAVLVSSMGATAVLLFATPHSTLVQPWAILGGHIISATIGVAAHQLIPLPYAAAVAVGLSIVAMHLTHCLHPPGGATALSAVIGGPAIWDLGYGYVLTPVAINAGVILILGLVINNLLRSKSVYPAPWAGPVAVSDHLLPRATITPEDIRQALINSGTYLDVTDDDLWLIYQAADLSAQKRFLSSHLISSLSLGKTETLRYGDSIEALWQALHRSSNGCVVIIDAFMHVEGIVTRNDVIPYLTPTHNLSPLAKRISAWVSKEALNEEASVVGQIMTTPVVTVHKSASIDQVAAILAEGHFHHVPVVDERRRLLGVVTHAQIWQILGNPSRLDHPTRGAR